MILDFDQKWRGEQEKSLFVPKWLEPKTQRQLFYRWYYSYIRSFFLLQYHEINTRFPRVLEVGSGRGTISEYLEREFSYVTPLVAIDNTASAVELSKRNIPSPAKVFQEDICEPSQGFREEYRNYFDLVFSIGVAEHMETHEDLFHFFANQYQLMAKGGICATLIIPAKRSVQVLNVFGRDRYFRSSRSIAVYARAAAEAGFTVEGNTWVNPFPLFTPVPWWLDHLATRIYRGILAARGLFTSYPFRGSKALCQSNFLILTK